MNGLKEAFSRENLLKDLNFFALLNLGLVLTAVGIVFFKNPNHFAFGGTSGLSILLADLFPRINVGGFMWIINIVLVVLGFIFLGVKCMGWTIYSSFALSFFVSGCEWLYPSGVSLSGDAMLDLVFAVFLPALGAAIVFDIGASTGGTDIAGYLLQKKFPHYSIGHALMIIEGIILLMSIFVFQDVDAGLFGLISVYVQTKVIDMILYGSDAGSQAVIITQYPQEISQRVIQELEVVTPSTETPVRLLSGGNVQKVLLGREIKAGPNVLITAYPVRGLDINSSYAIYNILNQQKKDGVGILFVGEDLDVMLALCDKIMVLCHGRVMGVVHAHKTTKEELGLMMTGALDLTYKYEDKPAGIARDSNIVPEDDQDAGKEG